MPIFRSLVLAALVAGLFYGGWYARTEIGLELSQESITSLVAGLGWRAWLVFLLLVVFRSFLLLPSIVVLSAGGIAFGTGMGTLLNAIGLLLSALLWYGAARGAGRPWISEWLGTRTEDFQRRADAAGPLLVGVATAHPAGPATPFHLGCGLAGTPLIPFVLAVALGAPVRASALAFFGSTLLDFGTPRFYAATAVILVLGLLPLAHRGIRERIFGAFRPTPSLAD